MPRRAKSICRQPGCGALIEKPGHCETHRKANQTADAEQCGTAHERGYHEHDSASLYETMLTGRLLD